MNNLKFRAWHPEYEVMIYFTLAELRGNTGKVYIEVPPRYIDFRNPKPVVIAIAIDDPKLIIMRYLGDHCRDKNGTGIYEGDLVRLVGTGDINHTKYIYVVTYKAGSFWATCDGEYDFPLSEWHDNTIKIGNICEDK